MHFPYYHMPADNFGTPGSKPDHLYLWTQYQGIDNQHISKCDPVAKSHM